MNRIVGLSILAAAAAAMLAQPAAAAMYQETKIIEEVLWDAYLFRQVTFEWMHDNPSEIPGGGPLTPDEYADLAAAGLVKTDLTIQVDDLDENDWARIYLWPVGGSDWQYLGMLEDMDFSDPLQVIPGADLHNPGHMTTTTFSIDPTWVDGLPVKIKVSGWFLNPNQVEIEKSTLTVELLSDREVIPAPAALALGLVGLALVGWRMRRYA